MVILDMQRYAFIFNSQEDYCLLSVDSPPARLPPQRKPTQRKKKRCNTYATPFYLSFISYFAPMPFGNLLR